ncbi:MAG: SLC13 family permease [Gammaproteobacteria bacterium]|nr:SLC13 family permease [Gammaproteobacteria bacterium]MDH3767518.1 SLC13 family permease [Gammaproteobacteria bacterium]
MQPIIPDAHAIFALLLTVVALFLFTRDRVPLESSCLVVLVTLVLVFEIFPYERNGVPVRVTDFFAGFGHEALITIAALLIVGRGLEATGALRPVAILMSKGWKERPKISLLATLIVAAALSAFLNNTPIVVMLLPIMVSVALRNRTAPSEILMPMGLATLIGGMATTIGTSTNLLVVGIAADLGLGRMSMFYFTLPVLIAGSVGILFLWLIAPRLLPERRAPMQDTSPRIFNAQLYVNEESFATGKTLSEVLARTDNRMTVSRIQRGEGLFVAKLPSVVMQVGDRLYVNDTPEMLKEFEQLIGATLHQPDSEQPQPDTPDSPLPPEQQLAEVVVTRGSLLHHRTLRSTRFTTRFRLVPLAIHRARTHVVDTGRGIDEIRLRAGDVLLVQGSPDHINGLKRGGQMLVLDGTTDLPHTKRANTALGIIAFVVISAATGLLPISVSSLTGVALMILTRCLDWRNAAGALSTPVILIIVASLGLGVALMATGGAEFVAHLFVAMTFGLPTPMVLSGLMLLIALLTNVVSNNAAAVIGTPIAVSVATEIGAAPEAFVLAVLFGANMSFATPMGYQTNLLVFSAGGYKFSDFLRVGIPLTIIMWLAFSFLMPMMYQLD